MNNILFSLLFGLLLISCVDNSHKSKEQLESELTKNKSIELFDEISKFEYENHEYIYFRKGFGKSSTAGVVHNPNCHCK